MQHLATVIFRIHHIRAGNPDSGRAMAKILGKSWGQTPRKAYFSRGLRFYSPTALMAPLPAAWRFPSRLCWCRKRRGDVAGFVGSRRSSGVATHREATALKRKRRRARRWLWPSDGAAHGVPLVELRRQTKLPLKLKRHDNTVKNFLPRPQKPLRAPFAAHRADFP